MAFLIVLIPTLILLAWQQVSANFIPGPAMYFLIVLTLILVPLTLDSKWVILCCQIQWCFFSLPLLSCWLDRKWVNQCQIELCPLSLSSYYPLDPVGMTGSEWLHVKSGHFLLSWFPLWSCWLNSKWVIPCQAYFCPFSISSLPLWSCWFDSKWVIPCQIPMYTSSHFSDSHFGPDGLMVGCEWFHPRASCVHAYCVCSCFDTVDLTASEWFHARFSHVISHHPPSHSHPVGLTGCEWFHVRSSCVFSHCSYSNSAW